jgi:exonuclease SbcC
MRLTRLYLRNYRVFEDELDLAVPAGLVGIYGPNGAGKSALIESIRFGLYGKARTPNDQIRTTGVNADCVTEIEFEHEGHLYVVRRRITGVNHTMRAEAHCNGAQVAEGVRDVATYVHSVIGMDDTSFRSSVFAEQKQVAAFSGQRPQQRRDLVLRLLGITPLDRARDAARADAKAARGDHDRLSARLPDLGELEELVAAARLLAETSAASVAAADAELVTATSTADAAEVELERLADVHRTWTELVADGKAAAATLKEATERVEALEAEVAALAGLEAELSTLRPRVEGIDALEALLAAEVALAAVPAAVEPAAPEPAVAEEARARAEAAAAAAAELSGSLKGAQAELARAEAAASRSAELSPDEDCPVCGQSLGEAFEQVVEHRSREVAEAQQRITDLRAAASEASAAAKVAAAEAEAAVRALAEAQQAWSAWEHHVARRSEAEAAVAAARSHPFLATYAGPVTADELADRRRAVKEVDRLEARLERAPQVAAELEVVRSRAAEAAATREALLEKVKALGFDTAQLEAAKTARANARQALKVAADAAGTARQQAATAAAAVELATTRLDDGKAQHADIADLAERSRHLGRLGDLLHDFRNNVVATVGPRLAAQAAELFAELTDHEYDQLEVDAETYEIQIRDGGRTFGMDRFSGSEVDLANLALRVAISEHVRFQSGGAVGLLVLDEVFGPLDDERKERMLLALERLRGRFRQVLVVTHDSAIKEQLPAAIQVHKLPGRRAKATLLTGG